MSQKMNESGAMPAAVALISAERAATYALPAGANLSRGLSETEVTFVRQRTDHHEADRPFLLWCLAGLIVATVTCGAIAMSAIMTITSAVN
jgi:hypothetical protein